MTVHNRLSDRFVRSAKPGSYCDGQGLWLHVSPSGAKKWLLRFSFARRVREMGLGNAWVITLSEARDAAQTARRQATGGVDPIVARREGKKAAAARVPTFGECCGFLIESKRSGWRSEKHAEQWRRTLSAYCGVICGMPVDEVDVEAVLSVLRPIWKSIPETASRLRARIEAVLGYAAAHNWRTGDNPAVWNNRLEFILAGRPRGEKKHLKALPYAAVPEFVARLKEVDSIAARALLFTILTASRTNEILGARWDEIDRNQETWAIPSSRTKSGRAHIIPLSGAAMAVLEGLSPSGDLVFAKRGKQLPANCMIMVMRQLGADSVPHGFRSSFRDYIGDRTTFPRELVEMCLSHRVGSQVEAAYRRSTALERRREIMTAWSAFCWGAQADNIVPIRLAV